MLTQELRSVFLAEEDSDYCKDPIENQAGEVLFKIPEQAVGKWGALLLFGVEASAKSPTSRLSLYCFKNFKNSWLQESHVLLGCCTHCLDGKSSRDVTTATSTAFPSTPSSCHTLWCVPWQDVEIPLTAPLAHPCCRTMYALPSSQLIPGCTCASLLCVWVATLFFSISKLQKYLIKGGFTFKPLRHVKLYRGVLNPTNCWICALTTAAAVALSVSLSVCLTFSQEQVKQLKRNKFI